MINNPVLLVALALHRVRVGNDNGWLRHVLDYRIDDNPFLDALRCITIACAAFILVWCFKNYRHTAAPVERLRWAFFFLFGLFVFLQEGDQIGQPFLIWRMPMLLTLSALGICIQWLREEWTRRGRR